MGLGDAGGTVVIATGRNEESAGRYHRELGLDTPLILYNGARVVEPRSGVRLLDLQLGPSWPVLRDGVLPRLPPGVGAVGFRDERAYVLHPAPALVDYAHRGGITLAENARRAGHQDHADHTPRHRPVADLVRAHVTDVRLLQSPSSTISGRTSWPAPPGSWT